MADEEISQALNDLTYTSISLYVKDTPLKMEDIFTFELNALYVIKEDMYVRSSFDALPKGVRLYILSNHATNQAQKDETSSTYILKAGSHFKLIGKPDYQGRGALILLHLPDKDWEEFTKDTFLIDTLLVNYATREFEVQCGSSDLIKSGEKQYISHPYCQIEKVNLPKKKE
ncbi:MAG: hypothetical protein LKJ88_01775 [Bacilli bacterium]|jgi:hypothetical protein|nr:hypothetical protein [Bacilli bacterium]